MPAQSKSQQRFFGVVKAMQKGDIPKKGRAGKIAKSMDKDDVDDFASTKHKGKPEKVKREQRVRELIKKMVREELNESSDTFVNILNRFGFKKGARDWGGHQFFVHKSKNLYATYNPNGRSLVIEPKRGGKPVFDSDRSNFSIRALLSYLQSPKNKFVSTEGKLTEKIGKGISFDMLKLGNTVKYTMGMDYKVVKLSSSKATLQLINTLKNVNKSMFAKKFDISKRDFDNAILDRQIRFITKGSAKVNEGTCGYGENGELGEEPAGPHLIKKKKIKESGRNIAKTILQQLGGNKFIAMTGAKNLGFTNNGLQMKIGRNSKVITHVIISLKSTDTYDVEFIKMRGVNRKVVKKLKGVYADQLGKIFTKFTGLRTRL